MYSTALSSNTLRVTQAVNWQFFLVGSLPYWRQGHSMVFTSILSATVNRKTFFGGRKRQHTEQNWVMDSLA